MLGVAVGFALARWRFPGRELVDAILLAADGAAADRARLLPAGRLGRRGWLGGWLERSFGINLIFTWQGAVIAAAIVAFPLVFKSARAAFESVDAQLEQAARVLGLGATAVFFRVTLPLAWRGILAGVLLAFARALGEFGATLMVAGSIPGKTQTLSIAVYEAVQAGQDELANLLVLRHLGRPASPCCCSPAGCAPARDRAGHERAVASWDVARQQDARRAAARFDARRRASRATRSGWCCSARRAPARA